MLRIPPILSLAPLTGRWMDGWVDGWMEGIELKAEDVRCVIQITVPHMVLVIWRQPQCDQVQQDSSYVASVTVKDFCFSLPSLSAFR